jgi:hypothetical protein
VEPHVDETTIGVASCLPSTTTSFRLIGDEAEEQLPLVAFQLAEERDYDEFDVASQLAACTRSTGSG